jgi:hypothetical protein
MLLPTRKITFTSADTGRVIVYDYVCEVEINKSYLTLTDTATITIPRKLIYKSGQPLNLQNQNDYKDYVVLPALSDTENTAYVVGADALFKVGDKVKIEIGFFPNMQTRFEGYISKVVSSLPIQIQCEDKMWILKKSNVIFHNPDTWVKVVKRKHEYITAGQSLTLKQLLDGILNFVSEKIDYVTVDDNINLGKIRIDNVNAAKVLEILKDRYGLYSYFRDDGKLYVGFGNNAQLTNVEEFVMEDVVLNNETLQWTNYQDVPIKVKGISINADNTKFEYEAGQDGGDFITQYTYNQTQAGLKKWVDNLLPTLTYDGWRGDIQTIGEPLVNHGDICKLISKKMPERNGSYLIKAVKIVDGTSGYFQTITLGIKL